MCRRLRSRYLGSYSNPRVLSFVRTCMVLGFSSMIPSLFMGAIFFSTPMTSGLSSNFEGQKTSITLSQMTATRHETQTDTSSVKHTDGGDERPESETTQKHPTAERPDELAPTRHDRFTESSLNGPSVTPPSLTNENVIEIASSTTPNGLWGPLSPQQFENVREMSADTREEKFESSTNTADRNAVSYTNTEIVPKSTRPLASFDTEPEPVASSAVIFLNATKGNISSGFSLDLPAPGLIWHIVVPEGYGIVLDFHSVVMTLNDRLTITVVGKDRRAERGRHRLAPLLIRESAIYINFSMPDDPDTELRKSRETRFSLSYNSHPSASVPQALEMNVSRLNVEGETSTVYDCRGIANLPQVIMCDGIHHCLRGEDEIRCAYRLQGCGDWLPAGDGCFKATFLLNHSQTSGTNFPTDPLIAEESCRSKYGATLASLQDPGARTAVANMIRHSGFRDAVVGLMKVKPVSRSQRHLYRFLWQWGSERGSPIAYELHDLQREGAMHDCAVLDVSDNEQFKGLACSLPGYTSDGYICMRPNPLRSSTSGKLSLTGLALAEASSSSAPSPSSYYSFSPTSSSLTHLLFDFPTKRCPDGSEVQTFHRCRWGGGESENEDKSKVGEGGGGEEIVEGGGWSLNNLPLFQCRWGPGVHYSLLCDGKGDCADRSDELHCGVPRLAPILTASFVCTNLQAVDADKRCDGQYDCFDESDEEFCTSCGLQILCGVVGCLPEMYSPYFSTCPELVPRPCGPHQNTFPGEVEMDGYGMSEVMKMHSVCQEGFYHCQGGHCVPTFMLNNGEHDCPRGEDEGIPVNNMTCPGYYRCQTSGSCLHRRHVCDGVYHCPLKDDEMYCHTSCPVHICMCEGQAYTCSAMIDPLDNLFVRYLDLSGTSDVILEHVPVMEYLSFLNLSSCGLTNVSLAPMLQLTILDLRSNLLTGVSSLLLDSLPALKFLDLSNNPVMPVLGHAFTTLVNSARMFNLETLVLRNVVLNTMQDRALGSLSDLRQLDIRGNPVQSFDRDAFSGLTSLQRLDTDEPKLCCDYFHDQLSQCHAPVDELSSCADLLAQDFFRVCLWVLAVLAVLGNTGVLLYRLVEERRRKTPVSVSDILVKSLCASDLLMGVYLVIIGVADAWLRGVYVARDNAWKGSLACSAAGFLSFVSSEVSAFTLCLVTLDRVLVICCPFSPRLHLSPRAAVVVTAAAWLLGLALASLPLLAGMELYHHNGICIPLPITRQEFSGQGYAFGVFIVLNFVLFLFIGAGQVLIYRAVRKAGSAAGRKGLSQQDMTVARRLFLIALTDFCCWFPIGVAGLLAAGGTAIPGQVNVLAAIFVLPLNSALNPFLYTLNGVLQSWRDRRLEQRARKMLGHIQTEIPKWQPAQVEALLKICVRSKRVEREPILRLLGVEGQREEVMTSMAGTGHQRTGSVGLADDVREKSGCGFTLSLKGVNRSCVRCGLSEIDDQKTTLT